MADEGAQGQGPMAMTLDDIILYFSLDEWQLVTEEEKQLYWEFLEETYQSYLFVGGSPVSPTYILASVACNERPICVSPRVIEEPPPEILYIDEEQLRMDIRSLSEQVDPLEIKEEDIGIDVEGDPEPPHVSATGQRSVPDSGRQLHTEAMEWASGNMSALDAPCPCCMWVEFIPTPVHFMMPERPAEPPSRRMMIPPQHGFAMGAEQPMERMWFTGAPCDERCLDPRCLDPRCLDPRCQAVALPPLTWSQRQVQENPPPPQPGPAQEKKIFLCAWCREPFKLQINLEVHYRYCLQKKQQPALLLRALQGTCDQYASASSSTGGVADSVLPENSAQCLPSIDSKGAFPLGLSQPQPQPVRNQAIPEAAGGTTETPRSSAAPTFAVKKMWRCAKCGEKFVYKWQFMSHQQGCRKDAPGEQPLPPNPQGLAARELPENAETQEPCAAPPARPSTSKAKILYPCEKCGKYLSKYYIATHLARHEGERYKCLWCGRIFNFRSAAIRHKKQHFSNEEGIHCPVCGRPAGHHDCFCMIRKIMVAPDSDGRPVDPK